MWAKLQVQLLGAFSTFLVGSFCLKSDSFVGLIGLIISFDNVMGCLFLTIHDEINMLFFFFAGYMSYAIISSIATIFPSVLVQIWFI